jgi:hypothetical protein
MSPRRAPIQQIGSGKNMNTPIRMGPIQSDTIVFTTTTAVIISGALYHPRSTQSLLKLRDPGGERGSRLLPRASPSVLSISIQPLASSICRTLAAHDSERPDSSPSRASASLARLSQVSAISNRYFLLSRPPWRPAFGIVPRVGDIPILHPLLDFTRATSGSRFHRGRIERDASLK